MTFKSIPIGGNLVVEVNENRVMVVHKDTGEIRLFDLYRYKGTPEIRRARAIRRAFDYCVNQLYEEFKESQDVIKLDIFGKDND